MIPFASQHNSRLVLVNRRDYPGSVPFTDEERERLRASERPDVEGLEALSILLSYSQDRAIEFHDMLRSFVSTQGLSEKSVVVICWSFGSAWLTQFLAHVPSLPTEQPQLHKYIKRVVWLGEFHLFLSHHRTLTLRLDPPYHALGYPPPSTFYNPLTDSSHPVGEGIKLFPAWVSGYYTHGDSAHELEHRTPLQEPPPTILTMTPSEVAMALFPGPGEVGGSDEVFLHSGVRCGLWQILRQRALFISPPSLDASDDEKENLRGWNDLELRYVWCDHSVWELPWATWALQEELAEAAKAGREVRKVTLMRLRKANHFVRTFRAYNRY